jgi:hypothetical protein
VETAAGTVPSGWASSNWGTNTTAFSYLTTGRTGSRSVRSARPTPRRPGPPR